MDNLTRIASRVADLTGIGMEYLVVDGIIIAKFFNGFFVGDKPSGNNEVTAIAA